MSDLVDDELEDALENFLHDYRHGYDNSREQGLNLDYCTFDSKVAFLDYVRQQQQKAVREALQSLHDDWFVSPVGCDECKAGDKFSLHGEIIQRIERLDKGAA